MNLINSHNNTFCFSEDEEDLGLEVIENRINEACEINNENISSEEKEKYKYLFKIEKNLKINGGNYDYAMNKFLKESNKGLNVEDEEPEISEKDKDSRDSSFEERQRNLRIDSNNKCGDDKVIKMLTKSTIKKREEINPLFILYKKKFISNTKNGWYPDKVSYANKKYCIMTKPSYIAKNNISTIRDIIA